MRIAIGRNGTVTNVVNHPGVGITDYFNPLEDDLIPDLAGTMNVGDVYDPKDIRIDKFDAAIFTILFNLENRMRTLELKPALTRTQFRAIVKALMP